MTPATYLSLIEDAANRQTVTIDLCRKYMLPYTEAELETRRLKYLKIEHYLRKRLCDKVINLNPR